MAAAGIDIAATCSVRVRRALCRLILILILILNLITSVVHAGVRVRMRGVHSQSASRHRETAARARREGHHGVQCLHVSTAW